MAPAVAPGRLGVGAGADLGHRRAGKALHVGPVHGQGGRSRLSRSRHAGLQQGGREAGQGGRRLAIGARFPERAGQGPGRVLHLAVAEPVGPVLQSTTTPRRARSASGSANRAAWARVSCAGRPSARATNMPTSRVRADSCRARAPWGRPASKAIATPEASSTASARARGRFSSSLRAALRPRPRPEAPECSRCRPGAGCSPPRRRP